MKLPSLKKQRRRRLLKPEQMDLARANGEHERAERYKKFSNNVRIAAVVVGVCAIPILYIGWCISVYWTKPEDLPDSIYTGITAAVGFVFGKSNIFTMGGSKDED